MYTGTAVQTKGYLTIAQQKHSSIVYRILSLPQSGVFSHLHLHRFMMLGIASSSLVVILSTSVDRVVN